MTAPTRPITPLDPDNGKPAWAQIVDLFEKNGLPPPPTRLRDELVVHLVWARYGAAATPADSVRMPDSADEAAMMTLLGERWLRAYAPDRLRVHGDPNTAAQVAELAAEAWHDGFMDGLRREPWEDASDWAILTGADYAKLKLPLPETGGA